jgi:hypothetical protein
VVDPSGPPRVVDDRPVNSSFPEDADLDYAITDTLEGHAGTQG